MNTYKIWDLDGTVIDSSHRYSTLANGDIDLPRWIADNTRENIQQDKLLPLAQLMRSNYQQGHIVIICTARVLGVWDHVFLADHGIKAHFILSRALGDNRGDAEMKRAKLLALFSDLNVPFARWTRNATFYDDNIGVLEMAEKCGIRTRNAVQLNLQLTKKQA
tara:strand:+ start:68 stop:556 length:489 start_codon:yes stop_codon:yes gene_type:complete